MKKIVLGILTILLVVTPLIFSLSSSELFEFPKMLIIYTASGLLLPFVIFKTRELKKVTVGLLIFLPLVLFFLSQLVSTIFSIDTYTSIFGYYSRFNGGLLSLVSYLIIFLSGFLYLTKKDVIWLLKVCFFVGLVVALWGLPTKFGYDFTCLIANNSFSVDCWTNAFRPRERIFATLGQPNWLAAYLLIIILIGLFFITTRQKILSIFSERINIYILLILIFLFSVEIYWTNSRSAELAFIILIPGFYLFSKDLPIFKRFKFSISSFLLLISFFFLAINLTFFLILPRFLDLKSLKIVPGSVTSSTDIRKIVWKGAYQLGQKYPFFGTGVETFAYSYNFVRSPVHNLTSEWDYVYNKAHNEILNYFANSGYFGLLSYILMYVSFLLLPYFIVKSQKLEKKLEIEQKNFILFYTASLLAIFITNFFGFSTSVTSLYTYLLPAFLLSYFGFANKNLEFTNKQISFYPKILVLCFSLYWLMYIANYYSADYSFARGREAKNSNDLISGYQLTSKALSLRNEPVYLDQQAFLSANIAASLKLQKQPDAEKFKDQAISLSQNLVQSYPKNLNYWKTDFKVNYLLHLVYLEDKEQATAYLTEAVRALQKQREIAPSIIDSYYNLASIIYNKNPSEAKALLFKTLELKSNYVPAKELLEKILLIK